MPTFKDVSNKIREANPKLADGFDESVDELKKNIDLQATEITECPKCKKSDLSKNDKVSIVLNKICESCCETYFK